MKTKNYQEYFNKMIQITAQSNGLVCLSSSETDALYEEMLECLPNNGKLYKYRSFSSFENSYNSLDKGYIWLADANRMNDKLDLTLNIDLSHEETRLREFFIDKREGGFIKLLKSKFKKISKLKHLTNEQINEILNCYDDKGTLTEFNKACSLFQDYGFNQSQKDKCLYAINRFLTNHQSHYQKEINKYIQHIIDRTYQITKKEIKLFCLSKSPKIESMWAYYGGESKGFCIEYDFKKGLRASTEIKKTLLSLFQVQYKKTKPPFCILDAIKDFVINEETDIAKNVKYNEKIYEQLLTKDSSWKQECEWRILGKPLKNELFIDLVSAIYVDKEEMETEEGQRLPQLAKDKGWKIIVRELSYTKSNFIYKNYIS